MGLNILRLTCFLILNKRALALFSLMESTPTLFCQLRFVSNFTPGYFTLPVRYSLLTHTFVFKLPSNFFWLEIKITI